MTDINTLKGKYFAAAADLVPGGGLAYPYESAGNTVLPLVDGSNYFGALRTEVDALKAAGGSGKFFYFTDWLLGLVDDPGGSVGAGSGSSAWTAPLTPMTGFTMPDGSASPPKFIDELAAMAASGTDVRALVWVSPLMLSHQQAANRAIDYYRINVDSLLSVDALRAKPNMTNKVCLDTLAHPLGAMHLKMVVCGDSTGARGYVAGIDLDNSRMDTPAHPNGATFGWHDAGARVEGPAVLGIYGYFRQIWNEQLSRSVETFRSGSHRVKTYIDGTPAVPDSPPFPAGGGGTMHVQVLRTAPQMNFAFGSTDRVPLNCVERLVSGFRRDSWTSAPNGIFGFKAALQKAIASAQRYIYVEDQSFSGQPIMEWLRDALAATPALKLIMVHHADPADGAAADNAAAAAINNHLASAGVNMDGQVAFYQRLDGVVVHTKLWIIDDEFFIVGSANCMRRSLYTDGEISVGVIDEDSTDNNVAIRFRRMLWGEHCGLLTDPDTAPLTDLDSALKIWDPSWGGSGAAPSSLLSVFQRKRVPFEIGTNPDQWASLDPTLASTLYDQIDADSRLEY